MGNLTAGSVLWKRPMRESNGRRAPFYVDNCRNRIRHDLMTGVNAADLTERDRMIAEVRLGVQYVKLICGEPPAGCRVGVMWHGHNSGEYATVGLFGEPLQISDAPWGYISRAEDALSRFDDSVDWSPLSEQDDDDEVEHDEDEEDEGDEDEDEEARETSDV